MVDDHHQILRHNQSTSMERVLDALEQFNEAADGQDPRLVHGLVEVLMEAQDSADQVADGVGE